MNAFSSQMLDEGREREECLFLRKEEGGWLSKRGGRKSTAGRGTPLPFGHGELLFNGRKKKKKKTPPQRIHNIGVGGERGPG